MAAPVSAQQIVLDRGQAAGKYWLFPIAGDPHSYLYAVAQAHLARAVAELPLSYRAPLVLAALEERPLEEIAQLLGLRPGTVKTRLFRARERLRVRLQPYWKGVPS